MFLKFCRPSISNKCYFAILLKPPKTHYKYMNIFIHCKACTPKKSNLKLNNDPNCLVVFHFCQYFCISLKYCFRLGWYYYYRHNVLTKYSLIIIRCPLIWLIWDIYWLWYFVTVMLIIVHSCWIGASLPDPRIELITTRWQ